MGYSLRDRNRPIPNGITAYDSSTNTRPPAFSSFSVQCRMWLEARLGNPAAVKRYRLSTNMQDIEQEIDSQLARICFDHKWNDFFVTSSGVGASAAAAPPIRLRKVASDLVKAVEGGAVLIDWIKTGSEAVPQEQANKRAEVCVKCPLNEKGDWTRFFKLPVANSIRRELNRRKDMSLSTPSDDALNICGACLCVLKLKVHVPFEKFWPQLDQEIKNDLWESCWIRTEQAEHKVP